MIESKKSLTSDIKKLSNENFNEINQNQPVAINLFLERIR